MREKDAKKEVIDSSEVGPIPKSVRTPCSEMQKELFRKKLADLCASISRDKHLSGDDYQQLTARGINHHHLVNILESAVKQKWSLASKVDAVDSDAKEERACSLTPAVVKKWAGDSRTPDYLHVDYKVCFCEDSGLELRIFISFIGDPARGVISFTIDSNGNMRNISCPPVASGVGAIVSSSESHQIDTPVVEQKGEDIKPGAEPSLSEAVDEKVTAKKADALARRQGLFRNKLLDLYELIVDNKGNPDKVKVDGYQQLTALGVDYRRLAEIIASAALQDWSLASAINIPGIVSDVQKEGAWSLKTVSVKKYAGLPTASDRWAVAYANIYLYANGELELGVMIFSETAPSEKFISFVIDSNGNMLSYPSSGCIVSSSESKQIAVPTGERMRDEIKVAGGRLGSSGGVHAPMAVEGAREEGKAAVRSMAREELKVQLLKYGDDLNNGGCSWLCCLSSGYTQAKREIAILLTSILKSGSWPSEAWLEERMTPLRSMALNLDSELQRLFVAVKQVCDEPEQTALSPLVVQSSSYGSIQ